MARIELVREYLTAMEMDKVVLRVFDVGGKMEIDIAKQLEEKEGVDHSLIQELKAKVQRRHHKINMEYVEELLTYIIEKLHPILAEAMTDEEMEQAVAWAKSPIIKKINALQPQMLLALQSDLMTFMATNQERYNKQMWMAVLEEGQKVLGATMAGICFKDEFSQ